MAMYEFNGDEYLKASKHQKEWGVKLISELEIANDFHILDLGCGDGFLTKMIAEKVPNGTVVGIDASKGMIKKAKEFQSANCFFEVIDINDIDFKDEFDLIISNATLHWVKNHRTLLKNCFNALKTNGVIRFNFAGDQNCSNFISTVKNLINANDYRSYFSTFEWPWYMPSIDEYKKNVERSNFKDVEIWEENADRYFVDKDEMTRWIKNPSLVPFLKEISKKEIAEGFTIATIDQMVKATEQSNGKCFETFRRINVRAKK